MAALCQLSQDLNYRQFTITFTACILQAVTLHLICNIFAVIVILSKSSEVGVLIASRAAGSGGLHPRRAPGSYARETIGFCSLKEAAEGRDPSKPEQGTFRSSHRPVDAIGNAV
jgi:hypothetical protein